MCTQKKSRFSSFLKVAACTVALGSGLYVAYRYAKSRMQQYLQEHTAVKERGEKINQILAALQKEIIISLVTFLQSTIVAKKIDERFRIDQLQQKLKLCYSSEAMMENTKEAKIKHWERFQRTVCLVYAIPIWLLFYQTRETILRRRRCEKEIVDPTNLSCQVDEDCNVADLLKYHLNEGIDRLFDIISPAVSKTVASVSLQSSFNKHQIEQLFTQMHANCIEALFDVPFNSQESYLYHNFATCVLPSFKQVHETSDQSLEAKLVLNELYDYVNSAAYSNLLKDLCAFSFWNFHKQTILNVDAALPFPKLVAKATSQYGSVQEEMTEILFQLCNLSAFKEYSRFIFCNL